MNGIESIAELESGTLSKRTTRETRRNMSYKDEETAKMIDFAIEGMSLEEISERFDVSKNAVSCHLRRRGMRVLCDYQRSIMQRAETLRPSAARDYLLHCVELFAHAYTKPGHHAVDTLPRMTPSIRAVLVCLVDHRDKLVSRKRLHSVVLAVSPSGESEPKIVDVYMCHLRSILKSLNYDFGFISNTHGQGFTFVPGADFPGTGDYDV